MRSTGYVVLRPLASPPLPSEGEVRPGYQRRALSEVMRVRSSAIAQSRAFGLVQGELNSEITEVVCEIFKEELSDRAQARRFLWEFFD